MPPLPLAYILSAPLKPIPRSSNKQSSDPNQNLMKHNLLVQQYEQALRKQKLRHRGIPILIPMPRRTNKSPRGNHRNTGGNNNSGSNQNKKYREPKANQNQNKNYREPKANEGILQPFLKSPNNSKEDETRKALCMAYMLAVMNKEAQPNQNFKSKFHNNAITKSKLNNTATTVPTTRICEFITNSQKIQF